MSSFSVGVSPGRFAWLLGPADRRGDGEPDQEEFSHACDFALDCWQVLPAIGPKLFAWGRSHGAQLPAHRLADRIISLTILANVQLNLLRRLVSALDGERIPYVLLKGSAIRFTAYSDPTLRCGKDVDLAVPRRHLERAEQLAIAEGFLPAEWKYERKRFVRADPVERRRVEARHYELGFLARRQVVRDLSDEEQAAIRRDLPGQFLWHLTDDGELACYVILDIHHGLSLDITVEPLLRAAEEWTTSPFAVRVPPPEWTLFHLIYKIYWEGVHNYRKGGYQYADLSRALVRTDAATFDRLVRLLKQLRLEVAGYYVLRRLESDLGVTISPQQSAFLERHAIPPQDSEPLASNDLGDMWPKLWGTR